VKVPIKTKPGQSPSMARPGGAALARPAPPTSPAPSAASRASAQGFSGPGRHLPGRVRSSRHQRRRRPQTTSSRWSTPTSRSSTRTAPSCSARCRPTPSSPASVAPARTPTTAIRSCSTTSSPTAGSSRSSRSPPRRSSSASRSRPAAIRWAPTNRYAFSFGNTDLQRLPEDRHLARRLLLHLQHLRPTASRFSGAQACAYDRASMLTGATASAQCFSTGPSFGGPLAPPASTAPRPPPRGARPNYLLNFDANSLNLWKFHVDFANPASSTFEGPTNLPVAPFNAMCGGSTCISQGGGGGPARHASRIGSCTASPTATFGDPRVAGGQPHRRRRRRAVAGRALVRAARTRAPR